MMFPRLVVFAALATASIATTQVRLVTVPEAVRLPATPGENLVLEAAVAGEPSDVWLATDAAATDRVPLAATGGDRWQVNLADPRVAALLPAGRDGGAVFVFAKQNGATKQSAAVVWSRSTAADGRVQCLVRRRDGSAMTVAPGGAAWLDPSTFDRLELQGASARRTAAEARLGDITLPLQRHDADGTWTLACDAAVKEHLQATTAIEVEAKLGSESLLFRFDLVPARLDLPAGEAEFVVMQRGRAAIPGSNRWLTVEIDDITMGSTILRVVTADHREAVAPREMHTGDFVPLVLAEERHVLVIARLRNRLTGQDHAVLRVMPEQGFRPDRIAQLVRAVGQSPDTFVRDGVDYPGPSARQFLLAKIGNHKGDLTVEHFVASLASKSSTSGEPYIVRRADGSRTTMQEWLRQTLATIEAAETPAASPARR